MTFFGLIEFLWDIVKFLTMGKWLKGLFGSRQIPQSSLNRGTNDVNQLYQREKVIRHSNRPYTTKFEKEGFRITGIAVTPLDEKTPSPEAEITAGGINENHVHIHLSPPAVKQPFWGCHVEIYGEGGPIVSGS